MNREDMICNIDNITSQIITSDFDMLMTLYDLCNSWGYENIHISEIGDGVSFELTFKNKKQSKEVLRLLPEGIIFIKYGKVFNIDTSINENILNLRFIEKGITSWGI